jgi:hypothetical protein
MASTGMHHRKPPRTPVGCEDHLTRQQAAQLLGFPSEFKIRQLEREGRLHSVRGPMRTAFYARTDLLALKAELARATHEDAEADWTDAELLLLLAKPNREGRTRTALDLVLETRVSIDRAQKVCAFWSACQTAATSQTIARREAIADTSAAPARTPTPTATESPRRAETQDPDPLMDATSSRAPAPAPARTTAEPVEPTPIAPAVEADDGERRGEERLSRDLLIQELRDPDPRIRERAFARLKQAGH